MNRYILITGCSSGIGLCAAKILQQRGYQVIASVRRSDDVERVKSHGVKHVLELDLRSSESVVRVVEETLQICRGELFALFNNAAYGLPGAVEDLSRDALRRQFETNLFGTHELTVKLIPSMLSQADARIVQNSSVLGFVAMPQRGAYNASKFALEGLTDTLRLELNDTPIKVSLIEPGPILSDFRKNALQAFEEEIDVENSRHRALYAKTLARLHVKGAAAPFTLPPEAVVKRLIHALESRRPKRRYYVTTPTYIFAYLRRILPTSLIDRMAVAAAGSYKTKSD